MNFAEAPNFFGSKPDFSMSSRREVYLLDLPSSSGTAGVATRPDLVVKRLDCGTAGGRLPHGHPSMNGAASDFDPISDLDVTAFFDDGGCELEDDLGM
jgi:hypothetical protein